MPSSKARKSLSRPATEARSISEFASSIVLIILVWLVAELIFLPLAAESFTGEMAGRVTSIVAVLFVIAVGTLLPQTVRHGGQVIKLASRAFVSSRYAKGRQAKMKPVFEAVSWAFLVAVLGIIVSSLAYWINPVFGGMALFVTIVAVAILLLQAASSWPQKR
jgi:hypothetical protein